MRKKILYPGLVLVFSSIFIFSCQKETGPARQAQDGIVTSENNNENDENDDDDNSSTPSYNLNVELHGLGNRSGHIKFRQDPDPAKIITLGTKINHLDPNHEYLLQRAVDPINVVDGNCTSTSWLTLGKGLTPQSILTNDHGKGNEDLWRDVTMIPSGSTFDIHFQVIDAVTLAVVLTSDCYQYKVR